MIVDFAPPCIILGIETSCDETAAALVDHSGQILAQRISSQIEIHREWGGIVPELAARDHLNRLMPMINEVLDEAGLGFADLDAIAATCGPGLIGSILVGAMTGRTLAWAHGLPFLAINHLEGHALSPRLTGTVTLPCLLLLASGGHSMFVLVHEVGRYQILGQTLDDAAGEAFDKTARLLGLGWPGGPAIEQAASQYQGQKPHFILPRPMIDRPGCDLSFAGLKSAVRRLTLRLSTAQCTAERSAIASAFQDAVCDVLAARSKNAIRLARMHAPAIRHVVIAGGVAANQRLRARLEAIATRHDLTLIAPPADLCTDNAAMIAWAAIEAVRTGRIWDPDFEPRPGWPLCECHFPHYSFDGTGV